jgi:hypothetical protein
MAQRLDSQFKKRARAVLHGDGVTEAALRRLQEEGDACARLLVAELDRTEEELARRAADPAASIADLATTVRHVNELRPDLADLHGLLEALDERAREVRATWAAPR